MHKKAFESIQQGGSKVGLLDFLQQQPGGTEKIMPFVPLFPGQEYTESTKAKIQKLCDDFGTDSVILRTTHASDFTGMVDTMPTYTADNMNEVEYTLHLLKENIYDVQGVRQGMSGVSLAEYAAREGQHFSPDEVVYSFAPFVDFPHFTLTEHPNQKGVCLIDQENGCYAVNPFTLEWGIDDKEEKQIKSVRDWIRELGVFDDNRALQIEGVFHPRTQAPLITQVRDFAPIKYADFIIENETYKKKRLFGVTEESGLCLPLYSKKSRLGTLNKGEKTGLPYMAHPLSITDKLRCNEQPLNMAGYFAGFYSPGMESLLHQNTRMVQIALRNNGVAVLNSDISKRVALKTRDEGTPMMRVISNGSEMAVYVDDENIKSRV